MLENNCEGLIQVPSQQVYVYHSDGELSHTTRVRVPDTCSPPQNPLSQALITEQTGTLSETPSSASGIHAHVILPHEDPQIESPTEEDRISDPDTNNSPQYDLEFSSNVDSLTEGTDTQDHESPSTVASNLHHHTVTEGPAASSSSVQIPELQSKLCKAISKVLGTTYQQDLLKLDSLHLQLKQHNQRKKSISTSNKMRYNDMLTFFRTLVLRQKTHIQNEVSAYEKNILQGT